MNLEMKTELWSELHLHTKLSDDISVIEPEEALLYAVTHFHRAIAFTNLNNVHDFPEIAKAHLRYADSDIKVIYGAEMRYVDKAGKIPKGITILAKNQWGIKEM